MHRGRCYCGAVTLDITAAPQVVTYCHCTDCRRLTGAPVAAFAAFPAGSVTVAPDPGTVSARAGVVRRFCRACGSPLTAEFDYLPGQVYVPLGVLDDAAALPPALHAHAGARLPWLTIADELPRADASARAGLGAGAPG